MRPARLLLACLLLLTAQHSLAVESLRCVGSPFPYIYSEDGGQLRGVAVEVLDALGKEVQFRCRFEIMPWKRAQALVNNGDADLLIGPYRTRERSAAMRFLGLPFYLDAMLLYARSTPPLPDWNGDFSRLAGRRIGVAAGWSLGERYEQAKSSLALDEANTLEQTFRKLMLDRVDLVASNQRNAMVVIQQLGLAGQVLALQPPLQQSGGYFALANKWRDHPLWTRMNAAQERMVRSGQVQAISARYGLQFPGANHDWVAYLRQEMQPAS